MKVLIADTVSNSVIEELQKAGVEVSDLSSLPKEELPGRVGEFDVMVVRSATKVRKDTIDRMENMKLIIRGGVGLDNIDVEYAKAKGIDVKNTPAASSISVAELVLAHLFALSRHIVKGTVGVKEGRWEKKTLKGIELFGKTLGIIGLGRIGEEIAKRGKALGMKVIGYDPYTQLEGIEMVDFDTLLERSDYISIHTPLTDETRHIIGKSAFEKMKQGVILVNCARGGIIDEDALLLALKEGKIGGVGLDVFEMEPPKASAFSSFPNVTFTPHIGAATNEAQNRIGEEIVEIVKKRIKDKG